jgi:hypothetical protein
MRDLYELPQCFPLHEQTCYLVLRPMIHNIGDEANGMSGVQSWVIQENETHRTTILVDSVAVEIFRAIIPLG